MRTIFFFRAPPPFYDNSLSFRAFRIILKIAYDTLCHSLSLPLYQEPKMVSRTENDYVNGNPVKVVRE